MEKVLTWVKSHPWEAGGIVFLVGIVVLYVMGSGGGSSSTASGPDANLSSYLAAETAQNQSDNALTAVQSQYQASTTQAGIAAAEQISVNNTWAASDLATTESNNTTSTENNLISQIGGVANQLGTVLTTSSGSGYSSSTGGSSFLWGMFGSGPSSSEGGSSSSSQSFVANSQQGAAEEELAAIANTQFHIGN
jgi:hypothetical protein